MVVMWWKTAGTISPVEASMSNPALRLACSLSKCWKPCLRPPKIIDNPSPSRRLAMIEPVIEAFTTL